MAAALDPADRSGGGAVDIALGIIVLLCPIRALLLYMAFWGFFTASLRPLAGEGIWELVERSYNYGVPLALLLLHGFGSSVSGWLSPSRGIPRLTNRALATLPSACERSSRPT